MSNTQRQLLIDINNISCSLGEEYAEKIKRVALNLLDTKLLETLPKLTLDELDNLDVTEKLLLLQEYSLSDEERKKEKEESLTIEQALEEAGFTIDDLQD